MGFKIESLEVELYTALQRLTIDQQQTHMEQAQAAYDRSSRKSFKLSFGPL